MALIIVSIRRQIVGGMVAALAVNAVLSILFASFTNAVLIVPFSFDKY